MSNIERASLLCRNCGEEAPHELTYAGNVLACTTCCNCGFASRRDVSRQYVKDLERRVRAKPRRMLRRFRRHPVAYSLSVVRGLATKPVDMWGEINLAAHSRTRRAARRQCEGETSRGNIAASREPRGDVERQS
ncbi:hypothetical protein HUO13_27975 [Saccharopolyspora erythraea]|uniref:hypothetical protein n=1 Tax=Saccharopolyspora erythraea TaxID=1836 RepID=UPI001BA7BA4C|nr:hypothetical protein [Saccharopolyspora erythraea]QUH04128.1 hypothetical protein HUO13_27975 [Saccharopolyspora erythraea]